ncbi:hypothetical protein WNY78_02555 [Psychroserpens sp. AS72]|uniref:hypothetical protein n=1 Tax=Psychroserpens sp. AS72 TaxID=3135775 RepID=UPI00317BAB41
MSNVKVNFSISQTDAKMLVASLEQVAYHTNNSKKRVTLLKIAEEIKFDFWQDNVAFNMLVNYLDPVTPYKIRKSSNLISQLSIDPTWISQFLYKVCNLIVKRMIKLKKVNKKFKSITSAQATKCKTVQNVLDLIKTTYESAE